MVTAIPGQRTMPPGRTVRTTRPRHTMAGASSSPGRTKVISTSVAMSSTPWVRKSTPERLMFSVCASCHYFSPRARYRSGTSRANRRARELRKRPPPDPWLRKRPPPDEWLSFTAISREGTRFSAGDGT